jgi:ADP-dependent NAD(P)H-hydrate dehydratase / NAD(P)H-hydrate epimerase
MLELLTPAEMAEADRRTIAAGTPGIKLMERAGRSVADGVAARYPLGTKLMVVCGPGNNGGDGFVAARVLRERGYPVRLALFGNRDALKGDAAEASKGWTGHVEEISPGVLAGGDVIVDALFGAGLARELKGEAKAAVETIAASGIPTIAVDLPSGIDGNTGKIRGAAVQATATVTFCRRKPGHLLQPGRDYCGSVTVAEIGISDATIKSIKPANFANEPELWRDKFPRPSRQGHKYDRGHAVVVSGPVHATGAARLAARAALRSGAGLVTIAAPKPSLAVIAASVTAVMVREANGANGVAKLLADDRMNCVVLGPGQGVGKPTRDTVVAAAKAKRMLVIDADAISSFAGSPDTLAKAIRPASSAVVTPHEGEFIRLFGPKSKVTQADSKIERARAAAKVLGAVVLLKGPDTVVASPDGRTSLNRNAPPWLATAGSGDVLAGIVAGLMAQGMPAFEAASAAVWIHGEAGSVAGPGMISEDLDLALHDVLGRLLDGGA